MPFIRGQGDPEILEGLYGCGKPEVDIPILWKGRGEESTGGVQALFSQPIPDFSVLGAKYEPKSGIEKLPAGFIKLSVLRTHVEILTSFSVDCKKFNVFSFGPQPKKARDFPS